MILPLDLWAAPGGTTVRALIIEVAEGAGTAGFTVDDLRVALRDSFPGNPGAHLGRLRADGRLVQIGEEPSRIPSARRRKVRRFALAREAA